MVHIPIIVFLYASQIMHIQYYTIIVVLHFTCVKHAMSGEREHHCI